MRGLLKLSIILALLFFESQTLAGGIEQSTQIGFDGFYGGLGVGVSQGTFRGRETATTAGTVGSATLIETDFLADTSFTGAVKLGYGWQWSRWYFGFYAQGNFYNLSRSGQVFSGSGTAGTGVTYSAIVRLTSSVSLGIKPGFFLSPTTLLYLQIAANYARAHVDKNIQSSIPGLLTNSTQNIRKDMVAPSFGLGVEQKISHTVSIWLNYLYNYYGNVTGISTDNNTQQNTRVRFNNSTFLAGINYYFNSSPVSAMLQNIYHAFHGFYLGIFGGYQQIFTRHVIGSDDFIPGSGTLILDEVVLNLKNEDALPGFSLGYNVGWGLFNLGFSADTSFGIRYATPTQFNSLNLGTVIKLQSTMTEQDFGSININPGVLIGGNTLLFAKFGAVFSEFKLFTHKRLAIPGVTFTNSLYSSTRSRIGFRLGLGIEHKLNSWLSLYLLDQYTLYSKIILNASVRSNIGAVIVETTSIQTKPHNNQVLLGVNFYI